MVHELHAFTADQAQAVEEIEQWAYKGGAAISLTGPAGSGKTTLVAHLLPTLEAAVTGGIFLTATTGKAASRLAEAVGAFTTTLHKRLYMPPRHAASVRQDQAKFIAQCGCSWTATFPTREAADSAVAQHVQLISFTHVAAAPKNAIVVIDEGSMISPSVYADLLVWCEKGARLLVVGDTFQLPPALSAEEEKLHGADFSVFAHLKGPTLSTVVRTQNAILDTATRLRTTGELRGDQKTVCVTRGRIADVVQQYLADPDDHAIITWRNEIRMQLNLQIRTALGRRGVLERGEPLVICKNGKTVMNGEIIHAGRIEPGPVLGPIQTAFVYPDPPISPIKKWLKSGELKVLHDGKPDGAILVSLTGTAQPMDGQKPFLRADFGRYMAACKAAGVPEPLPVTWGYALTAHKAQGSEYRRVSVLLHEGDLRSTHFNKPSRLPDGTMVAFKQRWLYTSISRAREQLSVTIGT